MITKPEHNPLNVQPLFKTANPNFIFLCNTEASTFYIYYENTVNKNEYILIYERDYICSHWIDLRELTTKRCSLDLIKRYEKAYMLLSLQ